MIEFSLIIDYQFCFLKLTKIKGAKLSVNILIAIIQLSGPNILIYIFIFCGRYWISSSNQNVWTKHGCLTCLSKYNIAYLCTPGSRKKTKRHRWVNGMGYFTVYWFYSILKISCFFLRPPSRFTSIQGQKLFFYFLVTFILKYNSCYQTTV